MAQTAFDLRTHIRDTKTGHVIKTQPYRLIHSKNHGEIYERPVGSNICWFPDGRRAPTLEQVAKINADAEKAKPRVLTTADLEMIKEDALKEGFEKLEKQVKAKAEAEFQARVDTLVADRLTAVLPKLGITGDNAKKVTKAVVPAKVKAGGKEVAAKPWEQDSAPVPTVPTKASAKVENKGA